MAILDGGAAARADTEDEAVRSVRAQKQARTQSLYAVPVRVYPKAVDGKYRRLKWRFLAVWLAIYYLLPWLRWDRGPNAPDQAVLLDLDNRRGYFFFIEIWPQEVFYFTGLLVMGAVGIFLATSLAGRVWCGYACPQTVWTDLFQWVERKIEGDRNARMKRDGQPLSLDKALRKLAKHTVWLLVAFATGGAWIAYFVDAPTVVGDFFAGRAGATTYFFVGLFTATTYLLAGWAREQVCTYMCPWPRFQAAMFDEDTLIVTYQGWRGEPRGKASKTAAVPPPGDCIDCGQCIAVCPTGIDIRDGNQLECIGCALCADACNGVMARLNRPLGLIGYDTARRREARGRGEPLRYRLARPRTVLYALLLLGVGAAMLVSLIVRDDADIAVLHDRTPLFVLLADGSVRNGYTIKILNKERAERRFHLSAEGLFKEKMAVVGAGESQGRIALTGKSDDVTTYRLYVTVPGADVRAERQAFQFVLTDAATGQRVLRQTFFHGPKP